MATIYMRTRFFDEGEENQAVLIWYPDKGYFIDHGGKKKSNQVNINVCVKEGSIITIGHYSEEEKLSKWISVKDKLPEIGTEVLVFCPHKIPKLRNPVTALVRYIPYDGCDEKTRYFWNNYYGGDFTHIKEAVTHWQPLPEPPES